MPHVDNSHGDFTAPAVTKNFRGLLFDMDGTIIDSTDAIVKHWHKLGKELGVDPEVILATSHGRRSIDVLRLYDEKKATWEYTREIEGRIPRDLGQDAVEVPGSRAMLDQLQAAGVPWAIVTSGTVPLVTGWLDVMELAHPEHLVTAEDVQHGKPDPACYRLGSIKIGLSGLQSGYKNGHDSGHENGLDSGLNDRSDVLVLEDAPAGVRAGKAAGFSVLALATTHSIQQLKEAGADWIVKDMRSLVMKRWDSKAKVVTMDIVNSLR